MNASWIATVLAVSALLVPNGAPDAQGAPTWRIGGEDDVQTQLGRYVDVVVTPRHIVVLERDAPFLKVFSHDGRLLQTRGRVGGGPGEFRAPTGVAYDSDARRLLVVDPSNARVSVYPVADTLESPTLVALADVGIRAICRAGDELVGVVRSQPVLLRSLRIVNDRLVSGRALGEPRTAHALGAHPLVRTRASDGPLHCAGDGSRVVVVSRILGEVHVVSLASGQQITSAVPGFHGYDLSVDNNSMTMAEPAGEHHAITDVAEVGGEIYLIAERYVPRSRGAAEPAGYRISRLDAAGPSVLAPSRTWRPIASLSGGTLCARAEPAPELARFPTPGCP